MGAKGKLRLISGGFAAYCPGCSEYHKIDQRWHFNGDHTKPTFNPSLLVLSGNAAGDTRCHSFIRDGDWQFLADCTHGLAGQTVALRDEESLSGSDCLYQ